MYFLSSTAVLCGTAGFFSARRRFEEFRLRYELDVSHKKLTESYGKLAELDGAKSRFLANVSHELRTPLTLILAPLQDMLYTDSTLSVGQAKQLNLMRTSGLRLLKLVNDLLEFVRMDYHQSALVFRPINLALLLPGLVDSVRYTAQLQGITLSSNGSVGPLMVSGDEGRLEKVFLNLLTNAIKFTPRGKGIVVRWKQEGADALVEVADQGIGIAEEDQARIFERFSQVDASATRKYQGAGIGLALARDLVNEHHGQLSVESTPGEGSTFRVTLPMMSMELNCETHEKEFSHEGAQGTQQGESETFPLGEDLLGTIYQAAERVFSLPDQPVEELLETDPGMQSGRQTVLVVDDEAGLRNYLVAQLDGTYRILQAGDGESGLRLAKKCRPDLALLDWMLPGMDGLALCQHIKADPDLCHTRVIMLTANGDENSKLAALRGGADDFMLKPFNSLEVKARVENLLLAQRLQEELRKRNVELDDSLRRLKETESQLVQSEKMSGLGTLAAGLLHEINNPLNYAMMGIYLLQQRTDKLDEKLQGILADVNEGMNRIKDIVCDLRAFAYPSQEMNMRSFDLDEALKPALRMLSYKLGDVPVEQELASECLVSGDPTQITHVLMNLIGNARWAVDRVPEGRAPCIRVISRREGDRLVISVRDNGVVG